MGKTYTRHFPSKTTKKTTWKPIPSRVANTYIKDNYRGVLVNAISSKRYYHFILRRGDREKNFMGIDLFFSDCKKLLQFF